MFGAKKPTSIYALHDFQRLLQLIRRSANESSTEVLEKDLYFMSLFVLTFFTAALHRTAMAKDQIESFVAGAAQELVGTFGRAQELQKDSDYVLGLMQPFGMNFSDASRHVFRKLDDEESLGIEEENFVVVCSSYCAGALLKLRNDGYLNF